MTINSGKKIAYATVVVIFGYIILKDPQLFFAGLFYNNECYRSFKAEKFEIKGLITNKFIDSPNHCYRTIIVNDNGHSEEFLVTDAEQDSLWNKLQLNDSLEKHKSSFVYYVKHNMIKDSVITKYDCKK
jgi:hypothetical protein